MRHFMGSEGELYEWDYSVVSRSSHWTYWDGFDFVSVGSFRCVCSFLEIFTRSFLFHQLISLWDSQVLEFSHALGRDQDATWLVCHLYIVNECIMLGVYLLWACAEDHYICPVLLVFLLREAALTWIFRWSGNKNRILDDLEFMILCLWADLLCRILCGLAWFVVVYSEISSRSMLPSMKKISRTNVMILSFNILRLAKKFLNDPWFGAIKISCLLHYGLKSKHHQHEIGSFCSQSQFLERIL